MASLLEACEEPWEVLAYEHRCVVRAATRSDHAAVDQERRVEHEQVAREGLTCEEDACPAVK